MTKQEGYYRGDFSGCSDPSAIFYFDGEKLWAPGSNKPEDESALLFIDDEPFDHRNVNLGGSVSSAKEWFNS